MKEGFESVSLSTTNTKFVVSEKGHHILKIFLTVSDRDILQYPSLKLNITDENELVLMSKRLVECISPFNSKEAIVNMEFPIYNNVSISFTSEEDYDYEFEILFHLARNRPHKA